MSKSYAVTALGELLIDFTPQGHSESGQQLYASNPGGAPANLLITMARQQRAVAFIGSVGNDYFGRFLATTLRQNNVEAKGLRFDSAVPTTLAFVHLEGSERSFSFYRHPGADVMLSSKDIDTAAITGLIRDSAVFHFGSLSLTQEPIRSATERALHVAKDNGLLISYDPNLRPVLWPNLDVARERIIAYLGYVDLLKLNREELELIVGHSNIERGSEEICRRYPLSALFVSLGEDGAYCRWGKQQHYAQAYRIDAVDTTGCGDAFFGTILSELNDYSRTEIRSLNLKRMAEIVALANAAGALTASRYGGIPAIPSKEEILQLQANAAL